MKLFGLILLGALAVTAYVYGLPGVAEWIGILAAIIYVPFVRLIAKTLLGLVLMIFGVIVWATDDAVKS